MTKTAHRSLLFSLQALLVMIYFSPQIASAGAYIFASEDKPDIITHPSGYEGVGGILNVQVCIDANAADASAMETPVRNITKQINRMSASTPNLFFGVNNNIPQGVVDFESLVFHELGHCTGLGHPNLGSNPGVIEGVNTDFTATGDGDNDLYAFDAGIDGVYGSNDDQRDDDQNLHWFVKNVNNPFLDVASPDSSNYTRDLAELPDGHDFAANAGRDVGASLGFSNTEAVMQQGQYSDEDQRSLQADDVATYKMAMTGLDETNATADDYLINMVYGGIRSDTSNCDIVIQSSTSGFGSCSVGAFYYVSHPNHYIINSATFTYNSDYNWFFNPVEDTSCTAADDTLTFANVTHNDKRYHAACSSVSYGPDYVVGNTGVVTVTAPSIVLGPGTTINGVFSVINGTP